MAAVPLKRTLEVCKRLKDRILRASRPVATSVQRPLVRAQGILFRQRRPFTLESEVVTPILNRTSPGCAWKRRGRLRELSEVVLGRTDRSARFAQMHANIGTDCGQWHTAACVGLQEQCHVLESAQTVWRCHCSRWQLPEVYCEGRPMIVLYTIHDWAAHGVNKLCDVL